MQNYSAQVAIIGGGLAGLTSAIHLSQQGLQVLLIEKKSYPFHKVCGEYVSNEVKPYLQSLGVEVNDLQPAKINTFILGSPIGKVLHVPLSLGGFGISRYTFDDFLYKKGIENGARFLINSTVNEVNFNENKFEIKLQNGDIIKAEIVIGSFGKRSKLDKELNRPFIEKRSPYVGIKYHVTLDFNKNAVALYNFKNGYCGINKIEENKYCLCYLTHRNNIKKHGSVKAMEEKVLFKNPLIKDIFLNSTFIYDKPEAINEISFERKEAVKDHILMAGDAAGMIAPLCGNGMAMAIHSAKIASEEILSYYQHRNRAELEKSYTKRWNKLFAKRLWTGRQIQHLFGNEFMSEAAFFVAKSSPALTRFLIKQTHGKAF